MIKEFEGKTEKEAIDLAIEELGLDREEFEVEVLERNKKPGFSIFKKGKVKIRIHIPDEELYDEEDESSGPSDEFEEKMIEYLETLIRKMGYDCEVSVGFRKEGKIGLNIESDNSGILIGKKGKNLDAIQLVTNVYAGRIIENAPRVIVDSEDYRNRREANLVRLAKKTADQVKRYRNSKLLEPMNPFERRLIHTALNNMKDVETKSEGDGLYKQVRIIYSGNSKKK
ncbi:MAG: RNA-binding cell elongation regulator Jag/EloR [Spirochaetia bacterium]